MAVQTYHGGCHCGELSYLADLDLSETTTKCNCTYCAKTRAWTLALKPGAFRLISGAQSLTAYRKHARAPLKHFCRRCGVVTHAEGTADYMGGPFVIVFIGTLDDATPAQLAGAPVRYCNGRDNLWQESPSVTSYL